MKGSDDIFEGEIRKQVEIAIDEANVIIFVLDVMTGIVDLDEMVANLLRKSKKKVFLAVARTSEELGYTGLTKFDDGIKEYLEVLTQNVERN